MNSYLRVPALFCEALSPQKTYLPTPAGPGKNWARILTEKRCEFAGNFH
ncbi:hypothetical protein [Pseudomonas sp. CC6-YY-74]|nr:hypothetical protein [Pseudomonas sp. CC6-YY-74]